MKISIKNYNFALILLIFGFIFSCKTSETSSGQQNSKQKLENALLWKIDGNSLKHPSYIFGTVHLIKADKYFLPKDFANAFNESKSIIFEVDLKKMNDISEQMKFLPKLLMKGDTTLKDLITEIEYKEVQTFFKKKNLPLFMFEKMKPMFLTIFAEGDFDPLSLQSGDYKSYEFELSKKAENMSKNTGGLETIEFQIDIIDQIPYKYQAEMLMKNIKNDTSNNSMLEEMYNLYQEQNISALYQSVLSDDISKYDKILLNNRNENWIPKMMEYMKKESSFFAVGAGHLGGEHGVLNLLKKEGYIVSPVIK